MLHVPVGDLPEILDQELAGDSARLEHRRGPARVLAEQPGVAGLDGRRQEVGMEARIVDAAHAREVAVSPEPVRVTLQEGRRDRLGHDVALAPNRSGGVAPAVRCRLRAHR